MIKEVGIFPYISIVVPVYNDSKGIQKCIEHLHIQSYPKDKYEIIIVNNNSNDETKQVIQTFSNVVYAEDDNI
ncbi:glycosyltransferase [bacterium]|jgi:glycosyltransferase AglE|nr:glycosyltransferase [bacterium]